MAVLVESLLSPTDLSFPVNTGFLLPARGAVLEPLTGAGERPRSCRGSSQNSMRGERSLHTRARRTRWPLLVLEAPTGSENARLGAEGTMAPMGVELLRQGSPNHRGLKWW